MNLELENLLRYCKEYAGGDPSDSLREASGAFIMRAITDTAILSEGADALTALPPHGASWLAVVLASAIEQNGQAVLTTPAVVALFRSWCLQLPDIEDDDAAIPDLTSEETTILSAMPFLCQSLVSHLSRTPDIRGELSADASLFERLTQLEPYTYAITWVRELLCRKSGSLLLLHPSTRTGFRIRFENVGNCFHLFSLIQHVLGSELPGGRTPNPAIAAAAQGKTQAEVTDSAWWHYGNSLSPKPEVMASIWGELSVLSIPDQIIILWPPLLGSRGWDSNFFGPQLDAAPPMIELVAKLSHDDCVSRLQSIGIQLQPPSEKHKTGPWWKLW